MKCAHDLDADLWKFIKEKLTSLHSCSTVLLKSSKFSFVPAHASGIEIKWVGLALPLADSTIRLTLDLADKTPLLSGPVITTRR